MRVSIITEKFNAEQEQQILVVIFWPRATHKESKKSNQLTKQGSCNTKSYRCLLQNQNISLRKGKIS